MSDQINKLHIRGGILFCDLKKEKDKQKPGVNIDKQKKPVWKINTLYSPKHKTPWKRQIKKEKDHLLPWIEMGHGESETNETIVSDIKIVGS